MYHSSNQLCSLFRNPSSAVPLCIVALCVALLLRKISKQQQSRRQAGLPTELRELGCSGGPRQRQQRTRSSTLQSWRAAPRLRWPVHLDAIRWQGGAKKPQGRMLYERHIDANLFPVLPGCPANTSSRSLYICYTRDFLIHLLVGRR